MGDIGKQALRVHFDSRLRLEFHGASVTSDGGLLAYRELDEALGLTTMATAVLADTRYGKNIQHSFVGLLRQSVFSRLAGYEDVNDAEYLRIDPTMRRVVGGRAKEHWAASTAEVGRFETETLTLPENIVALKDVLGQWIDLVHQHRPPRRLVLDMDSSVSRTHGDQEGSAYNGYFACTCYHPLFCFNQYGDLEGALLREGNVHSADDWRLVLEPIVARYRPRDIPKLFRADAAFANPSVYEYLEEQNYGYAIRLPSNPVLGRALGRRLTRPVGRPARQPKIIYHNFAYQAEGWDRPRRVIAKIEWQAEELFPRVNFVVTNLEWSSKRVVKFYNQRGEAAEQRIKEGKYALAWTRLSCHDFVANQVRLQLFALAYNLANFMRRLALPRSVACWTLMTLKEKLIKIGARIIEHSRYTTFQLAEVAMPRQLFAEILQRIAKLRPVPG